MGLAETRDGYDASPKVEVTRQDLLLIDHTNAAIALYLERLRADTEINSTLIDDLEKLEQILIKWGKGDTDLYIKSNRKKPKMDKMTLTINLASDQADLPKDSNRPQEQLSLHINTSPPSGRKDGVIPHDATITVSTVSVYRDPANNRPTFIPHAGIRFYQTGGGSNSSLYTPHGATSAVRDLSRNTRHHISGKDFGIMFRRGWGFASRTV